MGSRFFVAIAWTAVIAGVFFRSYNIDRKVYWDDEIYTTMRALGHTEAEWIARAREITDVQGLRALLHPGPDEPRVDIAGTVRALAQEEPQHPPLYYVISHVWVRFLGTSALAIRSLSVLFGLAALPAGCWLAWELFGGPLAVLSAAALLSSSPILVLYSQEAREYSLWTAMILVMSAAFLRAVRLRSAGAWAAYGISLAIGLYVYPLSGLVALAHGAYLFFAIERCRLSQALIRPACAAGLALVSFLPWLWISIHEPDQVKKGMETILSGKTSVLDVGKVLLSHLRMDFLDLGPHALPYTYTLSMLLALVLLAYAVYFLYRRSGIAVWAFIGSILLITTLPFVAMDILFSGERSEQARYFLPFYLGIDLALAFLFTSKAREKTWAALFAAVIALRLLSCAISSQAETGWTKFEQKSISLARTINHSPGPILMSDSYLTWTLSLADRLDSRIPVRIEPTCYLCSTDPASPADLSSWPVLRQARRGSTVFLFGPSRKLQRDVQTVLSETHPDGTPDYRCINVRKNCESALNLWW